MSKTNRANANHQHESLDCILLKGCAFIRGARKPSSKRFGSVRCCECASCSGNHLVVKCKSVAEMEAEMAGVEDYAA